MSTAEGTTPALSSATPALRGDDCPSWCAGRHDLVRGVDKSGRRIHPDDEGIYHYGPRAEWPAYTDRGIYKAGPLSVQIEVFRQDNFTDDSPAAIAIDGPLDPDAMDPRDARLLGEALIRAAETLGY